MCSAVEARDQSNVNNVHQPNHEQIGQYQPIVNSVLQSKHEKREHDQPIVNSVRIMISVHSKHHQLERDHAILYQYCTAAKTHDQPNVNSLEHSKHRQEQHD